MAAGEVTRVCIITAGVPSVLEAHQHHGAGLRTTHFLRALLQAECEVLVVAILPRGHDALDRLPGSAEVGGRPFALLATTERGLIDGELTSKIEDFGADAFVGVSAMAAATACEVVGDSPFWADVFGDLMAEAQAKAAVYESDASLARFWSLLARALDRADRFSAVSARQGDALVGQLGILGRLSKATVGEDLVHVIPCAAEPVQAPAESALDELRRSANLTDAFVAVCNGSFNTWCDVDTLYEGLAEAMARCPRLHFVATGGAVAGHDDKTYDRFRKLIADGENRDRFHLEGWVPASRLPLFYGVAGVALNIERPCYERRLGSENRVVEWLAAGVPVVTTACSEQGIELARAGVVERVAAGDARGLAAKLLALEADADRRSHLSTAGQAYARAHLGYASSAAALVDWARAPKRAGDAASPRVLRVGLVSEPQAMVALLEAYVAELGTVELLRRGVRWLWRRAGRG